MCVTDSYQVTYLCHRRCLAVKYFANRWILVAVCVCVCVRARACVFDNAFVCEKDSACTHTHTHTHTAVKCVMFQRTEGQRVCSWVVFYLFYFPFLPYLSLTLKWDLWETCCFILLLDSVLFLLLLNLAESILDKRVHLLQRRNDRFRQSKCCRL